MVLTLKISKARKDFAKIWKGNIQRVYFCRQVSPMGGEYFHETEGDNEIKYLVEANIQSSQSGSPGRWRQSPCFSSDRLHAGVCPCDSLD